MVGMGSGHGWRTYMAVRYNNSLDLHQTGILCKFLPVAVQNEAKRPALRWVIHTQPQSADVAH